MCEHFDIFLMYVSLYIPVLFLEDAEQPPVDSDLIKFDTE